MASQKRTVTMMKEAGRSEASTTRLGELSKAETCTYGPLLLIRKQVFKLATDAKVE